MYGSGVAGNSVKNALTITSSFPGAAIGSKGMVVRQIIRYVSWVQNVVRQFGPYLLWERKKEGLSLVRED